MNYQDTVEWMFQQLPMYQQLGSKAYRVDLINIRKLAHHLNDPHHKFKSVHVAGTNGKGSVSHMLASVLQESGYKVGLYTSPHLKDFRERIRINGEEITEEAVTRFIEQNRDFFKGESFSFFEMTVGMAFNYFAEEEVDVAVIEVGLGGRLDSTNIINPVLSVITNIGFDHTAVLGNELSQIAGEKAGIIKEKTPVVIGERHPETIPVFRRIAKDRNAPLIVAGEWTDDFPVTDLKGSYQKKNLATVSAAVETLRKMGWRISSEAYREGVGHTIRNTNLRGRWEILNYRPKVICDTAHNKEGLQYVLEQLQEEEYKVLHIVLGVVNDKDLALVLPLFPKRAKYYFSRPDIPRGLEAGILVEKAKEFELFGRSYSSVSEAYDAALKDAKEEDVIYVGGSTFTVAEII